MKYEEFKVRVLKNLVNYKNNILLCKENGTYEGKEYSHILPENRRILNLLPTVKNPGRGFKQYIYAHHLNSSQMMCYNFFKPLLDEKEGRKILLKTIKENSKIDIPDEAEIINDEDGGEYIFEYPGRSVEGRPYKDGTKFDFFLRLSTGQRIYCETKYTEYGFGKVSLNKDNIKNYDEKWNKLYKTHLKDSILLKNSDESSFYSDYQLNRLMSYIRSENDYVLLLLCYDNQTVKEEAEKAVSFAKGKGCNNVIMADWKKICEDALKLTDGTRYHRHYYEFKEKYLDY